MWSVSLPGLTSRGMTPEYRAVLRSTSGCGLAATTGTRGLALLHLSAVVPDSVKAMITRAPSSSAVVAAAWAIALPICPGSRHGWRARSHVGWGCAARHVRDLGGAA